MTNQIVFSATVLSLVVWIILLGFRGQFWRSDSRLSENRSQIEIFPSICGVIPARNEADLLPITLRSLLTQNYSGSFKIVLVDDGSSDGTAEVASQVAKELGKEKQLEIITGKPLPSGWTGKLWAMQQGIDYANSLDPTPNYILLTDADIEHESQSLSKLVTKAKTEDLDLVSLMVKLRCQSFWEKLLIPAFIFFFEKLYPFRWVNNPQKSTAAAAGGCILVKRDTLDKIGGIEAVKDALIDDCALATAVKLRQDGEKGKIWLGLSEETRSLRPYNSLETIWDMVARTAYTQLNYSPLFLLGTLVGMTLIYLLAPVAVIFGALMGNSLLMAVGGLTWLLMSVAYYPTIRLYNLSGIWALTLPAIALLYTLMTFDSALRHWQKRGGHWKGRVYNSQQSTVNSQQ